MINNDEANQAAERQHPVGNALQLKAGTASMLHDRSALVIIQTDLCPTE